MRISVYIRGMSLILAGIVGGLAAFIVHDGLLGGHAVSALPLQTAPQTITPPSADALLQLTVQAGAAYILQSRHEAIATGVKAIPPDVRRLLAKYFPPALLERVRYRIGQPTPASLPGLAFTLRDKDAITLNDVVVFRDSSVAHDDVLWAHELQHVRQYSRWGIAGFVRRYVQDRDAVEWEAYETEFNYQRAVHPAPPIGQHSGPSSTD